MTRNLPYKYNAAEWPVRKKKLCNNIVINDEITVEVIMEFDALREIFEANANQAQAAKMGAYMRDMFPFLGIASPERRRLFAPFLKELKKEKGVNWAFADWCWGRDHREFQYAAQYYLAAVKARVGPEDIPRIKRLIVTKSWWDTVDALDAVAGDAVSRFPELKGVMLEWSLDENIWLRRAAIDHQLSRGANTDAELLEAIILNNLGQTEFFINKAIGWSLRDYSKAGPDWVRGFISRHGGEMARLSVAEASKYI